MAASRSRSSPAWRTTPPARSPQAKRSAAKVDRPNALIKIPATLEGLEAITEAIAAGISVNVTLIFWLERYREVINAYLTGLEKAKDAGIDLSTIHSVASFFVSRVDTEIDKRLEADRHRRGPRAQEQGRRRQRAARLRGLRAGLRDRARPALLAAGANKQRPLWASTGVKDPSLPDTLYVTQLVAADVVNTMPEKTLEATFDHGVIAGDTITGSYADANASSTPLAALGVSYDEVTALLEKEGVDKFIVSWNELLDTVTARWRPPSELPRSMSTGAAAEAVETVVPPSSPTSSPPASRLRTRPSGARTPSPRHPSASAGPRRSHLSTARPPDPSAARRPAATGVDHIVLGGMGGSSLAPEVITAPTASSSPCSTPRTPDRCSPPCDDRLETTALVISSKSGSTVETDSQRRAYEKAFTEAGIDPRERIVVVTDPGSPLDASAREAGYRVFNADPNVGGRFSALTAFGLVPSGLAGVDIERAARRGRGLSLELAIDDADNPGLVLGAAIAGTPAATSSASSPTARTSSDSPTGPSSSSPSPPARTAPASCPSCSTPTAPEIGRDLPTCRSCASSTTPTSTTCSRRPPRGRDRRLRHARRAVDGRGSTRPPSPVACWASTRSTSPTSSPPRSPTRALLDARPEPATPAFVAGGIEVRGTRRRPRWRERPRRRGRCTARPARTATATWPSRPTSTASRSRSSPASATCSRRAGAPSDLRLGTSVPALHRSVPQGRPGRRRVPADHRDAPTTSRSRTVRSPSASSSRPRPRATPACSPSTAARSSPSTSPTRRRRRRRCSTPLRLASRSVHQGAACPRWKSLRSSTRCGCPPTAGSTASPVRAASSSSA